MLLPGPEAQQLAIYIGWLLHGVRGGAGRRRAVRAAGLRRRSWRSASVYAPSARSALVAGLFFGLKAAVLAIVLQAVVRIGRRALEQPRAAARRGGGLRRDLLLRRAVSARSCSPPALIGWSRRPRRRRRPFRRRRARRRAKGGWPRPSFARRRAARARPAGRGAALRVPAVCLVLWLGAGRGARRSRFGPDDVFSPARDVLLQPDGGRHLRRRLCRARLRRAGGRRTYGWLAPGEMLDGLGMAETTPGPLIMVAAVRRLPRRLPQPGRPAAVARRRARRVLVAWVTFVPCFLWIFLGAPYVERLRGNQRSPARSPRSPPRSSG